MKRARHTSAATPVLDRVGAAAILEELPVAALVVDETGTVVHRNRAGGALADAVTATYGAPVLGALRDELARVVTTAPSFPVNRTVTHGVGDVQVEVDLQVSRIEGGFVGVWSDVTAARTAARGTKDVADALASSATELTGLGDALAQSTDEASARAATVAAGSEQMSASIREIASSSAAASEGTATAVGAAGVAGDRLTELNESVAKIGQVSNLITSIAEQTHLLALNATIEAARAGEAGRGFAVVAGEVKSLADRTREATDEITAMIATMEGASTAAVESISEILRLIDHVQGQQSTVADAVREQANVADEMTRGVAAVATAVSSSAEVLTSLRASADLVARKAAELEGLVTG
ncbi:methyl-accepting chemotaxis protein [Isoptericola sp. b441]|uniref:Methyl-accepting chemotaxis protein n=1 Tax=Actinotalea lenta TaxID=3064654 RepID=A0ABT9DCU3_9CELL|nr:MULTISPECIES: methyl-accepting chemotaxis protein [unclassified Isoptericola]MDO8106737.1 methyl-accepting chemotaxis protein [Isoptericola sp. b441]MDO8121551.1 methyl-accepting chemotaxis protein [Isoptericola sp. b490]